MRFLDAVLLTLLFILLFFSMYLLWLNLPSSPTEFETYTINYSFSEYLSNRSGQFYSNMRYADSRISYTISPACSKKRIADFEKALVRLEEKTILSFNQ